MEQIVELGFGKLILRPYAVIAEIYEGSIIEEQQAFTICQVLNEFYQGEPYCYISNRLYSYSFNPILYKSTINKLDNLVGFSVVSSSPARGMIRSIEKMFINKKITYYDTLDEALEWAKEKTAGKKAVNHSA
ncbi:hypothetical protein [Robertkochia aurantiaca]|uniref:hypothetical protein n=1 Tax=Robertkochia aurantiaca TaxID=2873700 RepID=UPI001CCB589B|nr:hypothetical protein [Robertkochia sp. 3YJGBD-33]